jgi:hypothetical protein
MGKSKGKSIFYLLAFFFVLSMLTSSDAEVTVDADGRAGSDLSQ